MSLHLTPYWEAMASLHPGLTPARIISQERGMYRIQTAEGSMNASVSGKFQFESRSPSAFPAVGDYVMADLSDPDTVVIHAIFRQNGTMQLMRGKSVQRFGYRLVRQR